MVRTNYEQYGLSMRSNISLLDLLPSTRQDFLRSAAEEHLRHCRELATQSPELDESELAKQINEHFSAIELQIPVDERAAFIAEALPQAARTI